MSLIAEIKDRLTHERDNSLINLDNNVQETVTYLRGESGHSLVKPRNQILDRAIDLVELIGDVREGRKRPIWLEEALSMSDFPILFGYTLERHVLARYDNWPATWTRIARRRVVADFRNIEVLSPLIGGGTRLEAVPEHSEYPSATMGQAPTLLYKVKKFGRRMGFSFEMGVSDALNQLDDIPMELGQAARETENYAVGELFASATGPNPTFYSVGNANIIAGNPALSVEGLQAGFTLLNSRVDEQGRPILVRNVTLVVGPALEIPALNMLNSQQIETTNAGGTTNQKLIANNWMSNRTTLVVDPYLPLITTNANKNTQWYLFSDPLSGSRPALEIAFLRGHEQPELWLKDPDARRVGGGDVDPMDGSYETDAIDYRVRHILGASQVDPKLTVASNGSGA